MKIESFDIIYFKYVDRYAIKIKSTDNDHIGMHGITGKLINVVYENDYLLLRSITECKEMIKNYCANDYRTIVETVNIAVGDLNE